MTEYGSNLEHLQDELRRLDWLLKGEVAAFRSRLGSNGSNDFQGLYISNREVDDLLSGRSFYPEAQQVENRQAAADLQEQIDRQVGETGVEAGSLSFLRLPRLSQVFGLSAFETDLLLLCLAPEIEVQYRKLYAYLQDDVNRKDPSVDLALRLFCFSPEERLAARRYFSESAPLFAAPLLTLQEDPAEAPVPLPVRRLKPVSRVVEFLLGSDELDASLTSPLQLAQWLPVETGFEQLEFPQPLKASLETILRRLGQPAVCLLVGPDGEGRQAAAQAAAHTAGRSLLSLDLEACLAAQVPLYAVLQSVCREALMYGGLIYLDGLHAFIEDEAAHRVELRVIEEALESFPGLAILGSRQAWRPTFRELTGFVSLEMPLPDERARRRLWQQQLPDWQSASDLAYLAGAFRFGTGQIRRAASAARTQAWLRSGNGSQPDLADLLEGCRSESTQRLVSFASKVTPRRSWHDLVLPKDTLAQLAELCQQARYRLQVYDGWGFGRRLSLGKGLVALFSGTSGTGKTLAAEILAHELGLDLYRVDLSSVVSKYIGETEKNLSRVFRDAQESNAILFFDEADALFGKRTDVKDAHDRYANIEVNYLLQQVETYEGIVILASNMSKNIDPAFLRRLHFTIDFPFPDEDHRLRIWEGIFPSQAPLGEDLDFDFMARKFKIAGGNIKNVAVAAAFHAAADGGVISMQHLMLAMKREYQKLGKVCERADFEQYYDQVM